MTETPIMYNSAAAWIAKSNDTAAQFAAVWELQRKRDAMQAELDELNNTLKSCYEALLHETDSVFEVRDYRTVRKCNVQWIKDNMPRVYAECLKISDADCGRVMAAHYTRSELNEYLNDIEPELFEAKATIRITDFDAAVGGKKRSAEFEGIAYYKDDSAKATTRLEIKHPELHPELFDGRKLDAQVWE